MRKVILTTAVFFLSIMSWAQKELISKWEANYNGEYLLEIYVDKEAEHPLTSVMTQDGYPVNHILKIDDNGIYLFYSPYTNEQEMYAELKIVNGKHLLYFNGGALYFTRVYSKNEEDNHGK